MNLLTILSRTMIYLTKKKKQVRIGIIIIEFQILFTKIGH